MKKFITLVLWAWMIPAIQGQAIPCSPPECVGESTPATANNDLIVYSFKGTFAAAGEYVFDTGMSGGHVQWINTDLNIRAVGGTRVNFQWWISQTNSELELAEDAMLLSLSAVTGLLGSGHDDIPHNRIRDGHGGGLPDTVLLRIVTTGPSIVFFDTSYVGFTYVSGPYSP